MRNSDRMVLRITTDEGTGKILCRVVDELTDATDARDCETMVASLWANYSHEVTARFERTFSATALGGCGLPREVMEHHLLIELYRPHAFPILLAEMLAAAFGEDSTRSAPLPVRGVLLSLPPTAGDPLQLAALVESKLLARPTRSGGFCNFIAGVKAAAGLAVGVTTASLGVLRLALCRKTTKSARTLLAESLFVVFAGEGAHTRDIWSEIDKNPLGTPPPMILVLGHKPLEKRLRMRVEAKGGRVIHLMSVKDLCASIIVIARGWRHLVHLHRSGERDLGIDLRTSFHMRVGAWFLRGLMHDKFLRGTMMVDPENTVAVFGLVAHADSRLADLALRRRGAQTFHWLHGIVEDALHYRAQSSVCLCQNEVDAELRRRHGAYDCCRVYPEIPSNALPMETSRSANDMKSGALVITNLIHPDNRFADYGAATTLEELLRMTADCFRGMQISTFTWRPHPKETTARDFKRFQRLAIDLGFRVDNSTHLGDQIKSHSQVISTFSGSIGDVAEAGGLPAIFAGLPYEIEGHWGRLPEALKFRSTTELAAVLARLADVEWSSVQRNALLRQYNQPRTRPADACLLMDELHSTVAFSRAAKAGRGID